MEDHSRAFIPDLCRERDLCQRIFFGTGGADEKMEWADGCATG
jgi:hypothetical protein